MPTRKPKRRARSAAKAKKAIRIAGVMTGTSCDGIDAALIEFDASGNWLAGWVRSRPYPEVLRERVIAAQVPGTRFTARDWLELDRDLGEWMGVELKRILASVPRGKQPDLLAIHGQTIAHFPPPTTGDVRKRGVTWQAANLAAVAAATGFTVAGQFRLGDLAVGGQGAPLMPRFHLELAKHLADSRSRSTLSFLNIGGMANFSVVDIDPRAGARLRLGYDTGPGNCWIDLAVAAATDGQKLYDDGGKLAAAGRASVAVVEKILSTHPHFEARPPKSTGRDQLPWKLFSEAAAGITGADLVATATELTVESIFRSYLRDVAPGSRGAQEILVCGGGAKNRELLHRLSERFAAHSVQVRSLAEVGWDPTALEAQGFALFAFRALRGLEVGGEWTGASEWAPPAFLVPGQNWAKVAGLLPMIVSGPSSPRSQKRERSAGPSRSPRKTRSRR